MYKSKYLKYKRKYLSLKLELQGGGEKSSQNKCTTKSGWSGNSNVDDDKENDDNTTKQ